jgi:hypothetical protein
LWKLNIRLFVGHGKNSGWYMWVKKDENLWKDWINGKENGWNEMEPKKIKHLMICGSWKMQNVKKKVKSRDHNEWNKDLKKLKPKKT